MFLEAIANVPPDKIAYEDEMGIDTYLHREYGWAERGEKVFGVVSGKKYRRTGIVAAKVGKKVVAPMQYDGTMNHITFEHWFETILLPELPNSTTIVLDNASFHRKKALFALVENTGHSLLFLPPYSPELNKIEQFWAWLKRYLRKTLRDFDTFDDALCSAFNVC